MTQTKVELSLLLRAGATAAMLALALSGCEETKRALGYEKSAPDEFQVVQHAPLTMPPDFNLRPPAPGSVRPQEGTTSDQALAALMGVRHVEPMSYVNRDAGDIALLKRVGADEAQTNIRELVDKESQALADADRSFTDKLVFWRNAPKIGDGEQLDAAKETQRLRENQALGRAVTDGETPVIERKRKGMLEGVLGIF
ncbi:MAG: DUF3035 domain-containing protein [Magnetospirillum sp.]|nr:DUF3035 domain-containing protein [Magnetospirillum sp.]